MCQQMHEFLIIVNISAESCPNLRQKIILRAGIRIDAHTIRRKLARSVKTDLFGHYPRKTLDAAEIQIDIVFKGHLPPSLHRAKDIRKKFSAVYQHERPAVDANI